MNYKKWLIWGFVAIIVLGLLWFGGKQLIVKIQHDYQARIKARIHIAKQNLNTLSDVLDAYYQHYDKYPPSLNNRLDINQLLSVKAVDPSASFTNSSLANALFDPFSKIPESPLLFYFNYDQSYLLYSVGPDKERDITTEKALAFLRGDSDLDEVTYSPTNGLGVPFCDKKTSSGDIWISKQAE